MWNYHQFVSSFIGLAYEGISSFLHNERNKALHKAVNAMDSKVTIQHNQLMQLENSMLMYSVYNAQTLEKLVNRGQHSPSIFRTLYAHSLGLHHFSINS